ncbi:hypothetical protein KRE37_02315 [Elizabethkingia meningoseptica]|uniref:hypothetical protein n=1 Tax=Elizabethkingia meningoseptica TaxID=238 RepID=UPI0023B104E7|nr:hypothetical protein [Elizabethkingia meningoseptica]MDE5528783.1 hypothetical protein [Elizabethkingia meningoseptica]MDE5532339.1 hypothetical protein [Elizabethkingia meningoseptica]
MKNAPTRYYLFKAFFQIPVMVAYTATYKKNIYKSSELEVLFQFTLNHLAMPFSWLPQFFLSKEPYAFLSHFKSKGISVFLTPPKGQASL